jgi:hypothetical protein
MEQQVAHLYKIINTMTGEYYIGKHKGLDQKHLNGKTYWGSGVNIKKQIKLYGKKNFTYKVLVIGPEDYIYDLESKYVTEDLLEDTLCLNIITGGPNGYCLQIREDVKQKICEARAKQVLSPESYKKAAKTISTLIWMNDGVRSYRVSPDQLEKAKNIGLVSGRLKNYVDDKYRNKFKNYANEQWQKVKETGHTGHLIKVN